ncbi:MAG: rane protein [Segetibacter sp.]|jgi:chemotaxis protein MotB|nr:rane protein [Segetibacter sp.]
MKKLNILTIAIISVFFLSCGGGKKLAEQQTKYDQLNTSYVQSQKDFERCRVEKDEMAIRVDGLNKQIAYLKANNDKLSDLSNTQAQGLRRSIDNMGSTNTFIQELQRGIARKDSISMALVMNLKGALNDINDEDINIQIDKSVVYISISDKLLFKSGSYDVNDNAQFVLGKVAQVLNSKPDFEFLVEGHTDNVDIKNSCIIDNWDLSTKRATAIVRILQNKYYIDPKRMTAGGRSFYVPLEGNETASGRALNRRTRIIILPQLDQFMKLLEKPGA